MIVIPGATARQQAVYNAGRSACKNKYRKLPPDHLTWEERHWWIAGYVDMESNQNGKKANDNGYQR